MIINIVKYVLNIIKASNRFKESSGSPLLMLLGYHWLMPATVRPACSIGSDHVCMCDSDDSERAGGKESAARATTGRLSTSDHLPSQT